MATKRKSKRGGASAPKACRTQLRSCMLDNIRGGGTFRTAGRACMTEFNDCKRPRGRRKKATTARKGRCLKWTKGRTRCLKRAAAR